MTSDDMPMLPAFICHDFELVELIEQLDVAETMLLAKMFDTLTGPLMPTAVAAWARWWSWRVHQRLGDRPEQQQPQEAVTSRNLSRAEREAVCTAFEQISDGTHVALGLRRFARAMAAQLLAVDLDAEADRARQEADVLAAIDAYRRERPHGTPGDTSRIPPWPEVSRPGEPPEPNPWA